jgi:hypothetical protein
VVNVFIIAAGNGSRLGSEIPKALYPIAGTPNIIYTIHHVFKAAERVGEEVSVHVVCSHTRLDRFEKALKQEMQAHNNVHLLPISSGLGDGHAVMTVFQNVARSDVLESTEESIIIWGDAVISYPNIGLIEELLRYDLSGTDAPMVLPVVMEKDPYVSILMDSTNERCISADFSKMGEHHPSGFHDQCVFKVRTKSALQALMIMHAAYWKNGRYTTETRELTFLYLIHYFYNKAFPAVAYQTEFKVLSFNTVEEAKAAEKQLERIQ